MIISSSLRRWWRVNGGSALCALVLSLSSAAGAQSAPAAGTIQIGKVDSIYSGTLKEQRPYLVYLPPSYRDTTYLPQRYPVLYVLDGDVHFHSLTGVLQFLSSATNGVLAMPEMIVVAIPNTDRMRDLTPTRADLDYEGKVSAVLKTTGGGPRFLQFMQGELIPNVERTYRTAPYRVFVGHSLGGITVIDALFSMPTAFNAYVAIDPSLWWDNRVLLRRTPAMVSTPGFAGRTLFVGQANSLQAGDTTVNVHYASIAQFNSTVSTLNQSGLRYGFKFYGGDDHGSVPLITEYDAMRFIFDAYKPDIFRALDDPSYLTAHFAKVSHQMGYTVRPPEMMLDLLGHLAMPRDTIKAIALLRSGTEQYPASANAWSSYGDALMATSNTTQAIAAFEKALALKPAHAHAIAMLKTLRKQ